MAQYLYKAFILHTVGIQVGTFMIKPSLGFDYVSVSL